MEQNRYLSHAFLQATAAQYRPNCLAAAERVLCCAETAAGTFYIGTEKGVLFLSGARFVKVSGYSGPVAAMATSGDTVLAAAENGAYLIEDGLIKSFIPFEWRAVDAAADREGGFLLLAPDGLYRLFNGEIRLLEGIGFGNARSLAVRPQGDVFVVCEHAVLRRFGKRPRWGSMLPGMARVPEEKLTCIASDERGLLWVGTEKGCRLFDGRSEWIPLAEPGLFPVCAVTDIAFAGDRVLIGTEIGLYIAEGEKTRFYGTGRYLPSERVYFARAHKDAVWVGTEKGAAALRFTPMTLEEKESYYGSQIPFFLREGYFTSRADAENGDITAGRVTITDNDGLWTALFLAGQCMKYAVTKSEEALRYARDSFRALLKLFAVTGIPGFPARAYRRPGEDRYGNGNPEWHPTEDETGPLEWKGETSSDELTGHYYGLCWYYDLCADEEEKREIAACVRAMTDHLLTHGYTLCDTDGAPTTWAHFGPDALNGDDGWIWEKGINALEILTFLRIAYHVTGDGAYLEEQRRLAWEEHYATNMLFYKRDDAHSNHIDDRLGFFNIALFLRLETDEALLRLARLAVRRHYEYEKKEHNPYFDFVYAATLGCHADLPEAVRSLEEYPTDLRCYPVKNSRRPELTLDPRTADFGEDPHTLEAIAVSERVTDLFSAAPFTLDEDGSDSYIVSPNAWLLSYWYGRYHGLI